MFSPWGAGGGGCGERAGVEDLSPEAVVMLGLGPLGAHGSPSQTRTAFGQGSSLVP